MELKEIRLSAANAFVVEHHRHHDAVVGHKWSLGAYKDGQLVGVAIVGRPYATWWDDGTKLCVLRLATDGTRNACSFLYAACARRAKREGYESIHTYILQSESGVSLKAAGWKCESTKCGGLSWKSARQTAREKKPKQICMFPKKTPPAEYKQRWSIILNQKFKSAVVPPVSQ